MSAILPLSTLALVSLSFLLTGCIVRYTDFPQPALDRVPAPEKERVIFYHVDPVAYYLRAGERAAIGPTGPFSIPMAFPIDFPPISQRRYRELSRAFAESHLVTQTIPTTSPPEKGVYCAVDVKHKRPSELVAMWSAISTIFVGIFPSYSGTAVDVVRFDLYVDQELQTIYRYQVRQQRWLWAGLLPFFWINFFTAGSDEAFGAVVHQFLLDVMRDGYL